MNFPFQLSSKINDEVLLERGREVVRIEAEALRRLEKSLDGNFVAACRAILQASRRIVVTGMGKSGHIGRKLAATLSATGTPALFMHPAEAGHGDLGMLMAGDVLLVLSNSGNTTELRAVLDHARKMEIKIIGVASHRASLVIDFADVAICLPTLREACAANIAPTTSRPSSWPLATPWRSPSWIRAAFQRPDCARCIRRAQSACG